jgi:hypothetical protein
MDTLLSWYPNLDFMASRTSVGTILDINVGSFFAYSSTTSSNERWRSSTADRLDLSRSFDAASRRFLSGDKLV